MSTNTQPLPLVPDQGLHWGAALRAARVGNHLSLEHLATSLKLTVAQVEAIESGRLDMVHHDLLFAKGYVRNYARLLGVSLPFDALDYVANQQNLQSINHVTEYFARRTPSRKKGWWLFALLLLAVFVWQFFADAQLLVLVNK
jgi:cytoskeletal protein RodZ